MTETDFEVSSGQILHVYDTGSDGDLVVFWHHGTPNTGEVPKPLLSASTERRIRWISYDRPGYRTSTPRPGRVVASAAADVARIADELRIAEFAVMGHSGGGPHALACGALLPDRVRAVVCASGLAPLHAEGLAWDAGMGAYGVRELSAAAAGRAALEAFLESAEWDPEQFTPADHAALAADWSWFHGVVARAVEGGLTGMLDDELACVSPWGFDVGQVTSPVLYLYGTEDRVVPSAHAEWLAAHSKNAELWLLPGEGHISVLRSAVAALDWLCMTTSGP